MDKKEEQKVTVIPVDPFGSLKGTIIFEAKADSLGAVAIWAPNIDPFTGMKIVLNLFVTILQAVLPKSNIVMP